MSGRSSQSKLVEVWRPKSTVAETWEVSRGPARLTGQVGTACAVQTARHWLALAQGHPKYGLLNCVDIP